MPERAFVKHHALFWVRFALKLCIFMISFASQSTNLLKANILIYKRRYNSPGIKRYHAYFEAQFGSCWKFQQIQNLHYCPFNFGDHSIFHFWSSNSQIKNRNWDFYTVTFCWRIQKIENRKLFLKKWQVSKFPCSIIGKLQFWLCSTITSYTVVAVIW